MVSSAIRILKDSESLVLNPYRDPGKGVITIGWGNTFYEDGTSVKLSDKPLTRARAEELFNNISGAFERDVKKLVTASINPNQLGALTSLAYNVGIGNFKKSTLLKIINNDPNDSAIEYHFNEWNKSGGKILKGLIIRRKKEFGLYKKPYLNVALFIPVIIFFYTVLTVAL
ncbi:lysozyme [Flavobacterium gawalongense]|uniref:Lysozyme n=1 Tax=Flavobacterium gawalongense TaxID=2594432 RepID=A0A553BD84_9FLAO|nr:lysozyme [Flavobacterium gawalongense]TRX06198.1 lysozyme [Flavobacterium gawalongense]TRX06930.1 lysozyme [Flavobacterium gawalongense]TRX22560.1 lysozyme [Flavobacterium gawalongense]